MREGRASWSNSKHHLPKSKSPLNESKHPCGSRSIHRESETSESVCRQVEAPSPCYCFGVPTRITTSAKSTNINTEVLQVKKSVIATQTQPAIRYSKSFFFLNKFVIISLTVNVNKESNRRELTKLSSQARHL